MYFSDELIQRADFTVLHICLAPVEAVFLDGVGLLALTERGVERVRLTEDAR